MGPVKKGLIRRQRVLVWTSDPNERTVLRDQIARLGCEVKYPEELVADPEKYLERFPIDVALLDTDIRDVNFSAWGAACEKHRVPLVLIKTYDTKKPVDPAVKSARRVYKPIDGHSIQMTLTRAMQERSRNLIAQAAGF